MRIVSRGDREAGDTGELRGGGQRPIDATWVRIGNAEYARDNNSYSRTTLKNRHMQFIRDGRLLFLFRGKGGANHEVAVTSQMAGMYVRLRGNWAAPHTAVRG
jgi:DNA topoisomerase IB